MLERHNYDNQYGMIGDSNEFQGARNKIQDGSLIVLKVGVSYKFQL